jgi:hypothetical protein
MASFWAKIRGDIRTAIVSLLVVFAVTVGLPALAGYVFTLDWRGYLLIAAAVLLVGAFVLSRTLPEPSPAPVAVTAAVALPPTRSRPAPVLTISRAVYGALGCLEDVTTMVSMKVANNRLDMAVETSEFGITDPIPGSRKTLTIRYALDLVEQQAVDFPEYTRAILPPKP